MKHKLLLCTAISIAAVGANAQFTEAWTAIYPPQTGGIDEAMPSQEIGESRLTGRVCL